MRLQTSTMLALYSVLEAASHPDKQVSAAEIAERYGVSAHHLAKVLRELGRAGIPFPADEARLLLSEVLGVSRAWIMAHPEAEVPPDHRALYLSDVDRRSAFEPEAYIVGHREFYGLDFDVTPSVLIPRPETELLVDRALDAAKKLIASKRRPLLAVDLGTGSGALAIAVAVGEPELSFIAVDRSREALEVAAANATRLGVANRIDLRQGDLLQPVPEAFDLLVANLPYIPTSEMDSLMPDVRKYEPRQALDGGPDGTALIRRALEQAVSRALRPAALLFEIGDGQGIQLSTLAGKLYPNAHVRVDRDYAGFERILTVDLP